MGSSQTVLFHETVFGPIHSRRLGISLGINLLPNDGKVCTFDCLYCEAGFNRQGTGTTGMPEAKEVAGQLEAKLISLQKENVVPDVITFSGNGEPTLHPQFEQIVEIVRELRDKYAPDAKISVLSNSTKLNDMSVVRGLKNVDNNILKLDSAIDATQKRLNRPVSRRMRPEVLIEKLKQFSGSCIIQTMILRGYYFAQPVDNSTEKEISALIEAYKAIRPAEIMLYSIDRQTPAENLRKVEKEELEVIADRIRRETGIPVQVA